jgi:hypothetical protein
MPAHMHMSHVEQYICSGRIRLSIEYPKVRRVFRSSICLLTTPDLPPNMRLLLLLTSHNSLSQRLTTLLDELSPNKTKGPSYDRSFTHDISNLTYTIEYALNEELMLRAVERVKPDVIIGAFLTKKVPRSIWSKVRRPPIIDRQTYATVLTSLPLAPCSVYDINLTSRTTRRRRSIRHRLGAHGRFRRVRGCVSCARKRMP